jgi:hypothetical protein
LKQLQLIQILCINAPGAAVTADVAAKASGVNRLWQASKREKAASDRADTAFEVEKSGVFGVRRFTAR